MIPVALIFVVPVIAPVTDIGPVILAPALVTTSPFDMLNPFENALSAEKFFAPLIIWAEQISTYAAESTTLQGVASAPYPVAVDGSEWT
jgi:hypothetical protein